MYNGVFFYSLIVLLLTQITVERMICDLLIKNPVRMKPKVNLNDFTKFIILLHVYTYYCSLFNIADSVIGFTSCVGVGEGRGWL